MSAAKTSRSDHCKNESARVKYEILVLFQEHGLSTPVNTTSILSLWTGTKDTKAAQIAVSFWFYNENIYLMMCHTDLFFRKQFIQSP